MATASASKKTIKSKIDPAAKTKSMQDELDRLVNKPRLEARSMTELASLMLAVFPEADKLMSKLYGSEKKCELISVSFSEMCLSECRMNEEKYNRPIDASANQVGMRIRGNIQFLFKKNPGFFSNYSRMFPFVHTGCGGGSTGRNGYINNYDVTLCLDDFPLMKADYLAQQTMLKELQARDKVVAKRAQEICKSDFEYIAVCENLEKTRKAFDKAQEEKIVAIEAYEQLYHKSEEKAEAENPFDFDEMDRLGSFIK